MLGAEGGLHRKEAGEVKLISRGHRAGTILVLLGLERIHSNFSSRNVCTVLKISIFLYN